MSVRFLTGDCRSVLRTLPDESVHCVVTSPPFWGLRDYGTAEWEGGNPECDHASRRSVGKSTLMNDGRAIIGLQEDHKYSTIDVPYRNRCKDCGAVRSDSQIGLEPTPDAYVAELVAVFREVKRVLRRDGTAWLNLGDSYAGGEIGRHDGYNPTRTNGTGTNKPFGAARQQRKLTTGLKPKDLIGIPWRVAFALQADGWILRQDIIWSKPNPMPESVTDRCTKSHEYLFLLSKSARYFYDAATIAEPANYPEGPWGGRTPRPGIDVKGGGQASPDNFGKNLAMRNKRSVWEVATQPFSGSHFATMPPALIDPCIKAGTSEKGCCAKCGAPWVRQIEKRNPRQMKGGTGGNDPTKATGPMVRGGHSQWDVGHPINVRETKTLGWSHSCICNAAVVPATVLDPFAGAGTTGLVADRLQRNAILIERNPTYVEMARIRIHADAPLFVVEGTNG